jgi:hypothetical protein
VASGPGAAAGSDDADAPGTRRAPKNADSRYSTSTGRPSSSAVVKIETRPCSCSVTGSYSGMLYGSGEASVRARKSGTRATVWTPTEVTAAGAPPGSSGRSASNR